MLATASQAARDGCWSAGAEPDPLAEFGIVTALPEGGLLFEQGGIATDCYRVLTGMVRLSRLTADGRRCVMEFLLPGDVFGLQAGDTHDTWAEAACSTVVLRCPRGPLEAAAAELPAVAAALREGAVARLSRAQDRMLRLACLSATERVASFLLEMAHRTGGGDEILLPMGRTDLADHLGLRPETVCRILAALRRRGVIARSAPNRLLLRNRGLLERASLQGRRLGPAAA